MNLRFLNLIMTSIHLFQDFLNKFLNVKFIFGSQLIALLLFFRFYKSVEILNNSQIKNENRSLVLYAYFEKNSVYAETLKFFIDIGVKETDPIDYIFIIQGNTSTVRIPKYKNIKVIKRIKNDCYDFGAYGEIMSKHIGFESLNKYTGVIFINPSVIGPFLPKYWPDKIHWSEIFTSRLKGDVHAVGTSIVCLAEPDKPKGPRIEGMAFAATPLAIETAFNDNVFSCKRNKVDAIITGEYGFAYSLIKNKLNIDTLLLKYGSIDWRDKKNWDCNKNLHPTRFNTYDNISVHPLEVVFHKPVWHLNGKNYLHDVFLKETQLYLAWARERDLVEKFKKFNLI